VICREVWTSWMISSRCSSICSSTITTDTHCHDEDCSFALLWSGLLLALAFLEHTQPRLRFALSCRRQQQQ
jgi:hypothetical protein